MSNDAHSPRPWFDRVPHWLLFSSMLAGVALTVKNDSPSLGYGFGSALFGGAVLITLYVNNWKRTRREGVEREAYRDAAVVAALIVQSVLAAALLLFSLVHVNALTPCLLLLLGHDQLQKALYNRNLRRLL